MTWDRSSLLIISLLCSISLTGCTQGQFGQDQVIGTAGGAIVGGVLGNVLGNNSDRAIITMAGVAIGGLIGNRIGAMLDAQDQAALAAQQRQALLTQPDNATSNWSSTQSGASATIVASDTHMQTQTVKIVRDSDVAPAPPLDLINAAYVTNVQANVRLSPSSQGSVAQVLQPGTDIWAVGKVGGAPWIMAARDGKSIGYVYAGSVGPAQAASQTAPSAPVSSGFDLDAAGPVRAPADLDALGPNEATDTVTAAVPCRSVSTTVNANGKTAMSSQTACRSPDGSWDLD